MRYLKQNTAVTIVVGLFIDYADGKTPLTDNGSFDPTDLVCELIKGSSSSELTLSKTGGSNDLNLTGKGMASFELAVGNVDTLGQVRLSFTNDAPGGVSTETVLPFTEDFEVLPANVYDSMFGSDKLQVDVVKVNGDDYVYSTTIGADIEIGNTTCLPNSTTGFAKGKLVEFSKSFVTHMAVLTHVDGYGMAWGFYPAIPFSLSSGATIKCYADRAPTAVRVGDEASVPMTTTTTAAMVAGDDSIDVFDGTGFEEGNLLELTGSGSDRQVVVLQHDMPGNVWSFAPAVTFAIDSGSTVRVFSQKHPTSVRAGDFSADLSIASKVLVNKSKQNKSTGVITVYDDDGTTPILYLTPSDDGTDITLTPSTPS